MILFVLVIILTEYGAPWGSFGRNKYLEESGKVESRKVEKQNKNEENQTPRLLFLTPIKFINETTSDD